MVVMEDGIIELVYFKMMVEDLDQKVVSKKAEQLET